MRRFGIYQTSDRRWAFMSYNFAVEHGFDFGAYEKVYDLEMPDGAGVENVFVKLNVDRPSDYTARSLSTSDIVEMDGHYYYVDDIGFVRLADDMVGVGA